jgi:hypothetical protein
LPIRIIPPISGGLGAAISGASLDRLLETEILRRFVAVRER